VVDNASTDGTADALEKALPEVRVIRLDRNRGALARTVGVEAARTPYVAFADDDSWWAEGALERAAGHLDAHPRLALLAARILVSPTEELDPVCEEMARSPLARSDDLPGPSVLGFVACGAVVRRSAYLQVGGFHPLIFFGGEETVLAYDLAAAGWGLAYVDDVVAHHHPQPESDRHGRQRLLTTNALLSSVLRRPLSVPLREAARVLRHATDPQERAGVLDALRRFGPAMAQRTFLPEHVESQARLLASSRG
jgi:GT2 family glycosyltransferase